MSEATPDAPDLGAKVEFLASPGAHAGSADRIETIETHMAWVFLTEAHAEWRKRAGHYPSLAVRHASLIDS